MSAKEHKASESKTNAKPRASKPVDHSSAVAAKQPSPQAVVAEGGGLDPSLPTSSQVLQLQRMVGNRAIDRLLTNTATQPSARQGNHTGLPDDLKTGIESLSGIAMDDVHVHYNSDKPAEVQALAYTRGTDIYVAPEQERHLPHEAWHVVQQQQGRVKSTLQTKGLEVNDEAHLEAEASLMGAKAVSLGATVATERTPAAGNEIAPTSPSTASQGPIQRVSSLDKAKLYKEWSGELAPSATELSWMWKKLTELAGPNLKKLSVKDAAALLKSKEVTVERMKGELSQSERTATTSPAQTEVDRAAESWGKYLDAQTTIERVIFDVPNLGKGEIAMLRSAAGTPTHPNMLAWFSHGYEAADRIQTKTARRYGFAVSKSQSLSRVTSKDVYESLPKTMTTTKPLETTEAPGLYVQPHKVSELSFEIASLVGLVKDCDVAILLSFDWATTIDESYQEAFQANTPPLPPLIDQAPALSKYNALLLFTCRTPWSVNAAAEGSSKFKEETKRRVKEEALKTRGMSESEAETAGQAAVATLTASPSEGVLYPG